MKLYDAVCPHCGKLNRDLYPGETGGTMECKACLEIVKLKKKDIVMHTTPKKKLPLIAACL